MVFQVMGYFDNPLKSKRREISQFTYKEDLANASEAVAIAKEWKDAERYPFVFVKNTTTGEFCQIDRTEKGKK